MITESYVFWVLKLDEIRELLCIAAWASLIFTIISTVGFLCFKCDASIANETANKYAPKFRAAAVICAVLVTIFTITRCVVPSTTQMAMVKVIPAVVSSDFANKAIDDTNDVYRLGLEAVKKRLVEYVEQ